MSSLNQEEMLVQILDRVSRMEGMLLLMSDAKDIASKALDKADSAHKRINDMKDDTRDTFTEIKKSIEALNMEIKKSAEVLSARIDKTEEAHNATPKLVTNTIITALISSGIGVAVTLALTNM